MTAHYAATLDLSSPIAKLACEDAKLGIGIALQGPWQPSARWATIASDPMHPSLFPYHPERDVYRLLQVDSTADSQEISAACRRLARTFHPDRNRSGRAEEEMRVVNAVREMLTDPGERAAYDRARERYLGGWTPGAAGASTRAAAPAMIEGPGWLTRTRLPDVVERTLRALIAAFRTALGELWLTRCPACSELVEAEFLFCAHCGARVRRVRRLMPPRE